MNQKKENDSIGYADYLHIIFDDKCVVHFVDDNRVLNFTFRDVFDIAKQNGYKDGIILLIAESPLNGTVYKYGNYEPKCWNKVGNTMGYA